MKKFLFGIIIFVLIASTFVLKTNADISSGLVGYWRLDETYGISAFDSSGYDNTGTVSGALWREGYYGNALNFTSDYVSVPNSNLFNFSTNINFTISCWFYQSSLKSAWQDLVSRGGHAASGFSLAISNVNTIRFSYVGSNYQTATEVSIGWNFVVLVADRTNHTFIVLNNHLESWANDTTDVSSAKDMFFGRFSDSATFYLDGVLDEVRVFNRALSSQDISELYSGFTVTSSSDLGITISPEGNTSVNASQSQTFSISPKTGYSLNAFYVDSVLQGIASSSYTFVNVVSNHTIYVDSFLLPQSPTNIDVNYYLFSGGRYIGLILVIIALFLVNFLHKYSFLITVTLAFLLTLLYLRQSPPLVWEGILTLFVGIILMLTGVLKIKR